MRKLHEQGRSGCPGQSDAFASARPSGTRWAGLTETNDKPRAKVLPRTVRPGLADTSGADCETAEQDREAPTEVVHRVGRDRQGWERTEGEAEWSAEELCQQRHMRTKR